jgi:hypothetical protein
VWVGGCWAPGAVVCLAPPHVSTLSVKRYDFETRLAEHKMCVLIFCTTFIWNISYKN